MKKLLTLAATMLFTATAMFGQWVPSDTEVTPVGPTAGFNETTLLKTAKTDDGKIVMTWLSIPEGLSYNDAAFGYYLYMQVLDANGNKTLGEEGLCVSNQPTPSWTGDYAMTLAPNGDVLIAYSDVREDTEYREDHKVFVYRYTTEGEPVWDAAGIKVPAIMSADDGWCDDAVPCLCVSGDNIFVAINHTGGWSNINYQLQRLNDDGTLAWEENLIIDTSKFLSLQPTLDGDIFVVYASVSNGLDARRINADGQNVWDAPVSIELESIANSSWYFPTPTLQAIEGGKLLISYRKLLSWTGYIVMNRLYPDGSVLPESVNCNNTTDGDGDYPEVGYRDNKALVLWYYNPENTATICANMLSLDGDFMWTGDNQYGVTYETNDAWDFSPIAVVPQENGWVLFYGTGTSWNGAKFMVRKIDDNGNTMWVKMIYKEDCKLTYVNILNDEYNAYIIFIDEDGVIKKMCVDITDSNNMPATGINELSTTENAPVEIYNLQGVRVSEAAEPGIYIYKQGNKTTKRIIK